MKVHIVRSASVRPGRATWTELSERELLLFVAEGAVSQDGADTLQFMWAHFIESGEWRYREHGGLPIFATYRQAYPGELPDDVEVRCTAYPDGHYVWTLNPDHFTADAARGIEHAVRDSIDHGWRFHPPPSVLVLSAVEQQQRSA